jgi:hypothetical protein
MEQIVKTEKPWLWKPGQSGNPAGRPVGARTHYSEAFLNDLRDGWVELGKETMIKTAKSEPLAFFATCARLIPKDVQITLGQRYPGGLSAEDIEIFAAIKEVLPEANERQPGEVLAFVRDAIRAASAVAISVAARIGESK